MGLQEASPTRLAAALGNWLDAVWFEDVANRRGAILHPQTEVWTLGGLLTYYTVFVIELSTRRVHVGGSTPNPDTAFMRQVARTWTDHFDGFLLEKSFLIRDRDGKWVQEFTDMLKGESVDTVLCPPRAPNCNAYVHSSALPTAVARIVLLVTAKREWHPGQGGSRFSP